MKKIIRITAFFATLCWIPAMLWGCARREPDMLDEIVLSGEYGTETEGQKVVYEPEGGGPEGSRTARAGAVSKDAGSMTETAGGEPALTGMSQAPEEPECYVYICGAVQEAGVYRMEPGDRIFAVIEKAGGFAPEACKEYVNLAKPVADGLRIWIPTVKEAEAETETGRQVSGRDENAGLEYPKENSPAEVRREEGAGDGLVDINRASKEQLMSLTGIGEAKAQAIIAYRSEHGGFSKKEDIMKVAGIKQNGYDKIKDQITVNQE